MYVRGYLQGSENGQVVTIDVVNLLIQMIVPGSDMSRVNNQIKTYFEPVLGGHLWDKENVVF
jgi:hypothetical protein